MQPGMEAIIGLEVHVQLRTRTKLFCGCRNAYGAPPNSLTCPVCLGLPGALPAINAEAIRQALAFGLAVGADIQPVSGFYRKQYVYPDLPKGYQITQGPVALVEGGHLEIPGDPDVREGREPVSVRLERAHLEEDAGKSLHPEGRMESWVDLNRAGVPLLEIVSAPDLRSPQEASDYLKTLHRLVLFLGICDGNLEEGSFRCDANVSIRSRGADAFGARVEIKNLNSFRFVKQALAYEIRRQGDLVARGEPVARETRGWDAAAGRTFGQRTKEEGMDYRFFPEPDLPPLQVRPEEVEAVRQSLPERPEDRIRRYREAGIPEEEALTLVQSPAFSDYFEALARECGDARAAARWMLGEVSRTLNERGISLESLGLPPAELAAAIQLVAAGRIPLGAAREVVYPALLAGEGPVEAIVAQRGLEQVSDPEIIAARIHEVLAAHPEAVDQIRAGRDRLKGFLVGQVLKAGQGRLDPAVVKAQLEAILPAYLAKP